MNQEPEGSKVYFGNDPNRKLIGKLKAGEMLTHEKLETMLRDYYSSTSVPGVSPTEVSVPGIWGDHIADSLRYATHMQKLLLEPAPLTRWQRFRLWSPRRWAARVLRGWAERLDPQGWED